ncbi:MAG: phenylacetate--CoA ligase [Victivallales bacterium]|nr:phenylacetate--CoA ligase [Victivallales bacterium]
MWNPEKEKISPAKLRAEQSEALRKLVEKLYTRVPFYREKMNLHNIKPEDINSIDDISKLPFTTKHEMRDVYPYGLLAADRRDIVEIHTSSGTTGKPVVGAYTHNDIDLWAEGMARTLSMAGIDETDTIQNMYGYGMFTGGLGVHYGTRLVGANLLPASSGNSKRQLQLMQDFGSTAISCTPSYCLYLAEYAQEQGIDIRELGLKAGFFGAEPWSENMRLDIQNKLGLKAYDIYGLTEIIGPGVAAECAEQQGLHIFEDLFYPEIINPDTGEVLPDGEKGELVITTLTREGSPILRYRTRDITFIIPEPCRCGRTLRRIHRLFGRNDDMLIIRGVNVFPSQIEEILLRIEGVEPHYQIVVERQGMLDTMEVRVEVNETIFSDEIRRLEFLEKSIRDEIKTGLGVNAAVKLVEPKTIARSEGKAKRVIDNRNITTGA